MSKKKKNPNSIHVYMSKYVYKPRMDILYVYI